MTDFQPLSRDEFAVVEKLIEKIGVGGHGEWIVPAKLSRETIFRLLATAKAGAGRDDAALRVGLRQRFDALDAIIDLSDSAVFGERRALGKAVGAALDNATISAKTFPPYGELGAMTEPPPRATNAGGAPTPATRGAPTDEEIIAQSSLHPWPPVPKGGQHVVGTSSGILVFHHPTGTAIYSGDQRSQIKNRNEALRLLAERLRATPTLRAPEVADADTAEAFYQRIRASLLYYFGTTDVDLLTEVWSRQAIARDAAAKVAGVEPLATLGHINGVTRVVVIDHRDFGGGRILDATEVAVEIQRQDRGRTLKVFVNDAAKGSTTPADGTTETTGRAAKE